MFLDHHNDAYCVVSYAVTEINMFNQYRQVALPTIGMYVGEILVAGLLDGGHRVVEGNPPPMTVVIEFDSVESAEAWYNSPEYQGFIGLQHGSTANTTAVLAEQFVMSG